MTPFNWKPGIGYIVAKSCQPHCSWSHLTHWGCALILAQIAQAVYSSVTWLHNIFLDQRKFQRPSGISLPSYITWLRHDLVARVLLLIALWCTYVLATLYLDNILSPGGCKHVALSLDLVSCHPMPLSMQRTCFKRNATGATRTCLCDLCYKYAAWLNSSLCSLAAR